MLAKCTDVLESGDEIEEDSANLSALSAIQGSETETGYPDGLRRRETLLSKPKAMPI